MKKIEKQILDANVLKGSLFFLVQVKYLIICFAIEEGDFM
jgi:hypothetical protein